VNVEGSRRLFAAARAAGVARLVCISSTAAFEGCRSEYGKAKLAIEEIARDAFGAGVVIVRPGLVCGAQPGGIVGTLAKLVKKSPVVPIVGPSTIIHTVQDDELGPFIERLASASVDVPKNGEPIVAATEVGISFRDLLDRVALSDGQRPVWAPVPWPLVWSLVRGVELLHIPIGLRSDSLVSFIHLNRHIDFTETRRTGITFRPFLSGR
jgi:nucleoside-diphosphate-sugar epimerase